MLLPATALLFFHLQNNKVNYIFSPSVLLLPGNFICYFINVS